MPLFELYRMAKRKLESSQERNPSCSTSLSSVPESDFVELVWDNGQIMTQGQSSRTRKNPTSRPSHSPKTGDTDIENGTNTKTGKFGMVDSILNEIPMSMPSGEMGLSQDDEMVCWLNYPMVQSLQTEYRPNFFYELSGVTANELSTQDNFASSSKGSCNHSTVNSRAASVHNGISSDEGNTLEGSIAGDKATIHRNITSPSSPSHTLQFPTSFPYLRARISQNIGDSISYSPASHAVSGDSIQGATLAGSFPSIRMQKQDQAFPNNRSSTMNFSHFLGPAAFVKANLQNIGAVANPVLSSVEKVGSKDKGAAASSSDPAETLLESTGALRKETSLFCQPVVQSNVAVKHFETKPLDVTDEPPKAVCPGADSKNNKDPCESLGEVTTKRLQDGEKTAEPAVASSSVCSGNSGERASGDPSHDLKRKHCDIEDSECPSEDVEEESVGAKKVVPARAGRGSKRSRAAEVHNLSERRRRDRINEKMRALQELIPNCNKVDKASMLDEAIEYLKTLQLQVQVMSMGAGLYMPHMMLPAGMQHMHAAHMPHFSPMGVGIGMGMGFGMAMPDMNGGSSGCPMVQLPPTHGAQFPGTPMPIPAAMHGMAGPNFQLFGLPGQGLPMSMPHAPLIPMSGGSLMNPAMDLNAQGMMHPMENLDSGRASSSRNLMQNISPQVTQNAGATSSMKQTPAQCQDCQAMNENSKQPDVVQDNSQLPVATSTGAFKSANRNEDRPQSSLL